MSNRYIWLLMSILIFVKVSDFTLCLPVSSANHLFKQFGSRAGQPKCWAGSGFRLFDTLMVRTLERIFRKKKVDFKKKIGRRQKSVQNNPVGRPITARLVVFKVSFNFVPEYTDV